MAAKISTITELFHRFHNCEMQLKQSKIAACLITFKEVIERIPAIPKTEKEKSELHSGIEIFLRNLSTHKKFKEIFGEMSFGDTDLDTNLEFIKSMIAAQEEDIVERVKKDEASAEAQRLEIDREKQKQQEEIRTKIVQAIGFIDEENLPQAMEIINGSEDIREAVAMHYNDVGMQCRTTQEFPEAVKNYSKALLVSPEDENIHYNIGRAHYEAGDLIKAEEFLSKAMKLNPDFKEGKVFYDYLLKINHPHTASGDSGKPSGVFWQQILCLWRRPYDYLLKISRLRAKKIAHEKIFGGFFQKLFQMRRKPEVEPVVESTSAKTDEDAREDASLKQPEPIKRKNRFNGFFLQVLKKFKA